MIMTYVIGISGGSGAGKTYFSNMICSEIGNDKCEVISQDNYYLDRSNVKDYSEVNFDHPSSIDFVELVEHLRQLKKGLPVDIPKYEFSTHTRQKSTRKIFPNKILILDGTLLFTQKYLLDFIDFKIFIATDSDLRLSRRIERDKIERNRSETGIREQWEKQVEPMFKKYIQVSKNEADYIIQGHDYNIKTIVNLIKEKYQIFSQ